MRHVQPITPSGHVSEFEGAYLICVQSVAPSDYASKVAWKQLPYFPLFLFPLIIGYKKLYNIVPIDNFYQIRGYQAFLS